MMDRAVKIGVLAVQGAFIEHEKMLERLGAEPFEIRKKADLENDLDGLVLPGGESTVMGRLLRDLDLLSALKEKIEYGLPVLATCAGLILLAERLINDPNRYFATLPVTVKRNAYGRQLGSFSIHKTVRGIGEFPLTFIRAPYIVETSPNVEILAEVDGKIVGVRYENQLALAFHPEVTSDLSVHQYFLDMVNNPRHVSPKGKGSCDEQSKI